MGFDAASHVPGKVATRSQTFCDVCHELNCDIYYTGTYCPVLHGISFLKGRQCFLLFLGGGVLLDTILFVTSYSSANLPNEANNFRYLSASLPRTSLV